MKIGTRIRVNNKASKSYEGHVGTVESEPYFHRYPDPEEPIVKVRFGRELHNLYVYKLDPLEKENS